MASSVDQDAKKKNYIGSSVKKYFAGFGTFTGKVISFNRSRKYYKIKYDDGDAEDVELAELTPILVDDAKLDLSANKPKGRRGRKRKGDSPVGQKNSKAKTHSSLEDIVPVENIGNNSFQESVEKVNVGGAVKLEYANVTPSEKQDLVTDLAKDEASEERSKQRVVEKPPESPTPDSLYTSNKRGTAESPPSILEGTPCRLKRTRVINNLDPCLQQMSFERPEIPHAADDDVDRKVGTETVEIREDAELAKAWPFEPCSVDWKVDDNLDLGTNGKDRIDGDVKQQLSEFASLVLSLPSSSTNFRGFEHCLPDLFHVYSFLRSFSYVIFLSPFKLEEFAFALTLTDVCSMMDSVHLSLLQTCRRQLERLSKSGSKSATFTLRSVDWNLLDCVTWPSFLYPYLITQGANVRQVRSFFKTDLSAVEYHKLPVETKLFILSFLCDKVLDTEEARAEITRRASFEHDPEVMEFKVPFQKRPEKNLKDVTVPETGGTEVNPVVLHSIAQGNGAEMQARGVEDAANSIRVGRHLDEDGNLDECVLCAMDGNLICCDGCPGAFHSRCVGVTRQGLPPGDWYCPECRSDRQVQKDAQISRGVRGGELVVAGPDGTLVFTTCGYLMISTVDTHQKTVHRYYSSRDLPKVLKFLEGAGPNYSQLQNAVQQVCQAESNFSRTEPAYQNRSVVASPLFSASTAEVQLKHQAGQQALLRNDSELEGVIPVDEKIPVVVSNSVNIEQEKESSGEASLPSIPLDTLNATNGALNPLRVDIACSVQSHGSSNVMSEPVNSFLGGLDEKLSLHTVNGVKEGNDGRSYNTAGVASLDLEDNLKMPTTIMPDENPTTLSLDTLVHLSKHAPQPPSLSRGEGFSAVPGPDQTCTTCSPDMSNHLSSDSTPQPFGISSSRGLSTVPVPVETATAVSSVRSSSSNVALGENAGWSSAKLVKSIIGSSANGVCESPVNLPNGVRSGEPKHGQSTRNLEGIRGKVYDKEDNVSRAAQLNAGVYINKYANCDHVATAAFNLAVISGGIDDLVEDRIGTQRKFKPTNLADQIKAFTQVSSHFLWPSAKRRGADVTKEKCGWCFNCRGTIRRPCLLTQVSGQLAGGAVLVVGGIRPLKAGHGHYAAVAAYMLYMEESLEGLLTGPWESFGHQKTWRKRVEQPKTLQDVKFALLQLESSLRRAALSEDWEKFEEDAPESIASSLVIASGSGAPLSKKSSTRKRGRPPITTKAPTAVSYDGACFGVNWWRGGSLSRQVYNWESLSRTAIKRAGRQGSFKEVPELIYSKNSDLPRRTRRFAWQTRVEKITSVAQVALEVRQLDTFIKWNEIISPLEASTTHNIKGPVESDPTLWKAEILSKADNGGVIKYMLSFPKDDEETAVGSTPSQQAEPPANGVGGCVEKSAKKKQPAAVSKESLKDGSKEESWIAEKDVPLFLLKAFEEKTRAAIHNDLPKLVKKGKVVIVTPAKKSSFWKTLCSTRQIREPQSRKLSSWTCALCNRVCAESQSVHCQRCHGTFHRNCTQVEDSIDGREKVQVCKVCIKVRLGQRMRKPSYKLLVMQSEHPDVVPEANDSDELCPRVLDGATQGGEKLRKKRDRETFPVHAGRKKKMSLPESTSQDESDSTFLSEEKARKKKKQKRLDNSPDSSAEPSRRWEGTFRIVKRSSGKKKKKRMSLSDSEPSPQDENNEASQMKIRGRKKETVDEGVIELETEVDSPPEGRRTSGRKRSTTSFSNGLVPQQVVRKDSGKLVLKLGRKSPQASNVQDDPSPMSKTRAGRQEVALAADTSSEGGDVMKSPVKPKRLKIIFDGVRKAASDVKSIVKGEGPQRRSANGFDYGSKSVKSETDIEKFRRERLLRPGEVRTVPAEVPSCNLCSGRYEPGEFYVCCEYCTVWYHGVAVGLKPEDADYLVGFKCHRCRKCRAPSCPFLRKSNAGVKPQRRGAVDFGEVIDADNMHRRTSLHAYIMPLQSSWMDPAADKEIFADFGAATDQPAKNGHFEHDDLSSDFVLSDLELQQLLPMPTDLSSQAPPPLYFGDLLAGEDYLDGIPVSGLGQSVDWPRGLYAPDNLMDEAGMVPLNDGIPRPLCPQDLHGESTPVDKNGRVAK